MLIEFLFVYHDSRMVLKDAVATKKITVFLIEIKLWGEFHLKASKDLKPHNQLVLDSKVLAKTAIQRVFRHLHAVQGGSSQLQFLKMRHPLGSNAYHQAKNDRGQRKKGEPARVPIFGLSHDRSVISFLGN